MAINETPDVLRTVQATVAGFVDWCGPLPGDLKDEDLAQLARAQRAYEEARRKVRENPTDGRAIRQLTRAAGNMIHRVALVFDIREPDE